MKVAVIGASGIGKQHAKWFHLEGCDVVAFAGTTAESVEGTAQTLRKLFNFTGHGYTDVGAMLRQTKPDIVVVASPPHWHHEHAMLALRSGCHLYCEKPLLWFAPGTLGSPEELLRRAEEMCAEADAKGLVFGVNTQYAAAVTDYHSFIGMPFEECIWPERMFMRMESKNPMKQKEFESIWADLASHPISMLMKWCPNGTVDERSIVLSIERTRNHCEFDFVSPEGKRTRAEFDLGQIEEGTPERLFGVNGVVVRYEGRNDADGVYRSYLKCGDREAVTEDFVQRSVRAFILSINDSRFGPLVTGREGLRNLKIQLELLSKGVRG